MKRELAEAALHSARMTPEGHITRLKASCQRSSELPLRCRLQIRPVFCLNLPELAGGMNGELGDTSFLTAMLLPLDADDPLLLLHDTDYCRPCSRSELTSRPLSFSSPLFAHWQTLHPAPLFAIPTTGRHLADICKTHRCVRLHSGTPLPDSPFPPAPT